MTVRNDCAKVVTISKIIKESAPGKPHAEYRQPHGTPLWGPARQIGDHPRSRIGRLKQRVYCGWLVFTNRADALVWK